MSDTKYPANWEQSGGITNDCSKWPGLRSRMDGKVEDNFEGSHGWDLRGLSLPKIKRDDGIAVAHVNVLLQFSSMLEQTLAKKTQTS